MSSKFKGKFTVCILISLIPKLMYVLNTHKGTKINIYLLHYTKNINQSR